MSTSLARIWAVVSLAGFVWMTYWLVFATGYRDYFTEFDDQGRLIISTMRREDAPAALATPLSVEGPSGIVDARPGDIVLSYDGYPTSQSDYVLHSNGLPSSTASISLDRNGETYTIIFEKYPGSFSHVTVRWAPIAVAAVVWILGALTLAVFGGQRLESALFASWCFTMALWLVGDRATLWFIPLSRTISATLGPLLVPMYLDLAVRLVGWRSASLARWALRTAYLLFGLAALVGLMLVVRAGSSGAALFDLLAYFNWVLPLAGLSLIVGPAILGVGALRPVANRRLLAWAALATFIAALPSLVLDILPTLGGAFSRYRDIPIALYVVLPIVYGYLLFRAQHLNLDRLFSRTAMLLLLGVLAVLVFAAVDVASGGGANESLLIALVTALLVLVLVGVLYERFQDPIERVLYGESRKLSRAVIELTSSLPFVNEQADLVNMVLRDIPAKLGVQSAEFFLVHRNGQVSRITSAGSEWAETLPTAPQNSILLRQASDHAIWKDYPWAGAILTIGFRGATVGRVLLGQKSQEEPFNLKEIQFLESVLPLLDLGFERIWLNQSQEEALIQEIGSIARASLDIANDLHDGPVALLEAVLLHIDDLRSGSSDDRLGRLNQSTREAIRQIRSIVDSVRPRILTESTKLILQEAVDSFRKSTSGVRCEVRIDLDYDTHLSLPANDALYRIVRGALQNVKEHAQATEVRIQAHTKDGKVVVSIEDNGVGLARAHSLTRTELVKERHFGIQFFYDYAASAGGVCRVGPSHSGGTSVEIILPTLQTPLTSLSGSVVMVHRG